MAKKIITEDDDRDDGPETADDGKGKVKGKVEPYVPEFEIIEEGQQRAAKDDDDEGEADERLSAEQREEEEPDTARADETDEQRKDRRRQERRNKKDRQRAAMQRDKTELNFLRNRLEVLERDQSGRLQHIERRQVQSEIGVIDNRIQFLESQAAEADEILAKAVEANNGGDVVKLTNVKANITENLRRLKDYRVRFTQAAAKTGRDEGGGEEEEGRTRTRGQPEVGLSKVALGHAQRFYNRHKSWYDPNGTDEDSAIVLAIDQVIENEGFDPDSADYWEELEKRSKRRLPHRFKNVKDDDGDGPDDDDDDDDEPATRRGNGESQRRGPRMPAGGGGRGSPTRFALSAERKSAMIEAGVWDDPKLRDQYIRRYREWDEQNPQSRRQ